MTTAPRVVARRILVRHLTEAPLLRMSFADQIFAILDDLTAAGILPAAAPAGAAAPPQVPAPRAAPAAPAAPIEVSGAAIRAARKSRRWTQRALATRAGVTTRTVCRVECDIPVLPNTLHRLAAALDLTRET